MKEKKKYCVCMNGQNYYRYATSPSQALRLFNQFFMKKFGKSNITDMSVEYKPREWSRVAF
jgi:hypothetical protein